MFIKNRFSAFFLIFSVFFNAEIFANQQFWGATGHRIIGEIATSHLTSKAKKNVRKILGTESVAISSNWADFIKSDTTKRHLDPWHYINVKSGLTYEAFLAQLQKDTIVDAYTKINFIIGQFKNKTLPEEDKRFYLRMLVHLVGDIHQPLHVGRLEDLGGNRIKVFWFNETTNLHALWDDKLIEFQKLSYSEYTQNINHVEETKKREWQSQPISMWLFDSYQFAEKIYGGITQNEPKLGFRYNYDYVEIMNTQLLKGGVRLAGLLNELFG